MILFKKITGLGVFIAEQKKKGRIIGFVPTMGALHNGHISLINNSRQQGRLTVSSIFVNPTQFNDAGDFEKYPVTLEKDIDLLEKNGCDVLFLPSVKEIYPDGLAHLPHYQLGYLETVLEGKYRPGHFQGVCQVVHRLLNAVQPDYLYLGQKDYQQCMVIKKLIELENIKTAVVIGATLREADGLAMSSRNMRLNAEERKQAVRISETLQFVKKEIKPGYVEDLKDRAVQYLTAEGFKVDYVEIATAGTLELVQHWDGTTPLVILAAAYLNEVRLIDNMLLQ
ncbi:4-phosphopantoate--beta-alanine ligase [Ferruginibacter profundus]